MESLKASLILTFFMTQMRSDFALYAWQKTLPQALTSDGTVSQVRAKSNSTEAGINLWPVPTILPDMLFMPLLMSTAMLPTRSNVSHSAKLILLFDQLWSLGSWNTDIKRCLSDMEFAFRVA